MFKLMYPKLHQNAALKVVRVILGNQTCECLHDVVNGQTPESHHDGFFLPYWYGTLKMSVCAFKNGYNYDAKANIRQRFSPHTQPDRI